eukprot:g86.t1
MSEHARTSDTTKIRNLEDTIQELREQLQFLKEENQGEVQTVQQLTVELTRKRDETNNLRHRINILENHQKSNVLQKEIDILEVRLKENNMLIESLGTELSSERLLCAEEKKRRIETEKRLENSRNEVSNLMQKIDDIAFDKGSNPSTPNVYSPVHSPTQRQSSTPSGAAQNDIWITYQTEEGAFYYYNRTTQQSQWENPFSSPVETANETSVEKRSLMSSNEKNVLQNSFTHGSGSPKRSEQVRLSVDSPTATQMKSNSGEDKEHVSGRKRVELRQNAFIAIRDGDSKLIEQYLLNGSLSIFDTFDDQKSALHIACENGQLAIVDVLIQHGADVNALDANYNTPLHLCAIENFPECMQFLLQTAAQVDITNSNGEGPLHHAAARGHHECIKLLKEYGADKTLRNRKGQTPLALARTKSALLHRPSPQFRQSIALLRDFKLENYVEQSESTVDSPFTRAMQKKTRKGERINQGYSDPSTSIESNNEVALEQKATSVERVVMESADSGTIADTEDFPSEDPTSNRKMKKKRRRRKKKVTFRIDTDLDDVDVDDQTLFESPGSLRATIDSDSLLKEQIMNGVHETITKLPGDEGSAINSNESPSALQSTEQQGVADNAESSWFGSALQSVVNSIKDVVTIPPPEGVIKADLGESNKYVYDKEKQKWVVPGEDSPKNSPTKLPIPGISDLRKEEKAKKKRFPHSPRPSNFPGAPQFLKQDSTDSESSYRARSDTPRYVSIT